MRIAIALCPVVLLALACMGYWYVRWCGKHFDGSLMRNEAFTLKQTRELWLEKGRPNPAPFVKEFGQGAFVFTNIVVVKETQTAEGVAKVGQRYVPTNTVIPAGTAYHCCFGTHRVDWPDGVLAVTEDRQTLWIRGRDGKVTVAPEWITIER